MDITGRKLFVKALEEEGVDTIFAYPGGTVTDLFDELYKTNSINLVLPRHEQGLTVSYTHLLHNWHMPVVNVSICNHVHQLSDSHITHLRQHCLLYTSRCV